MEISGPEIDVRPCRKDGANVNVSKDPFYEERGTVTWLATTFLKTMPVMFPRFIRMRWNMPGLPISRVYFLVFEGQLFAFHHSTV